MKGHVFIVNNHTLEVIQRTNTHAVYQEDRTRQQWRKTRADILADLGCVRAGDRIFFYNIDTKAFSGIYTAESRLFHSDDDLGFEQPAPYRVKVNAFLPLERSISEHNLFARKTAARDFRSIFYKKVLNRGKACTHLFPDEMTALTEILLMQNDSIPDEQPAKRTRQATPMTPQFELKGNECSLEKELEWWLTHHIDSHPQCAEIFGAPRDIEMFANYIPINIAGGNIDLVVYHRKETAGVSVRNKISIVELKKGRADNTAFVELENYALSFIHNVVGLNCADIIQPIIIASGFRDEVIRACQYWNLCPRKPRLYQYTAQSETEIEFTTVLDNEPTTVDLGENDE